MSRAATRVTVAAEVSSAVPSRREFRSRWVLAACRWRCFCVQIEYFAMNLALPRMATELAHATDLQWVISLYMLGPRRVHCA